MFCGKCGYHLSVNNKFCTKCGEPNKRIEINIQNPILIENDDEIARKKEELKVQLLKLEEQEIKKRELILQEQRLKKEDQERALLLKQEDEKQKEQERLLVFKKQEEEKERFNAIKEKEQYKSLLEEKEKQLQKINEKLEKERAEREKVSLEFEKSKDDNEKNRRENEHLRSEKVKLEEKVNQLEEKRKKIIAGETNVIPKMKEKKPLLFVKILAIIIPLTLIIAAILYYLNKTSESESISAKSQLINKLNQNYFFDPLYLTEEYIKTDNSLTKTQKDGLTKWAKSSSTNFKSLKDAQQLIYKPDELISKYNFVETVSQNYFTTPSTDLEVLIPYYKLDDTYASIKDSLILTYVITLLNKPEVLIKQKGSLYHKEGGKKIHLGSLVELANSSKNPSVLSLKNEVTEKLYVLNNFDKLSTIKNKDEEKKEQTSSEPSNVKVKEKTPVLDSYSIKKLLVGKRWSECEQTIGSIGDIVSFTNTLPKKEDTGNFKTSVSLTLSINGETFVANATMICSFENEKWSLVGFNPGFCDLK